MRLSTLHITLIMHYWKSLCRHTHISMPCIYIYTYRADRACAERGMNNRPMGIKLCYLQKLSIFKITLPKSKAYIDRSLNYKYGIFFFFTRFYLYFSCLFLLRYNSANSSDPTHTPDARPTSRLLCSE